MTTPAAPDPSRFSLPTVNLANVNRAGWRSVEVGEIVKTGDQYFAWHLDPPHWILCSFMTSDRFVNQGRQSYTRSVSLRARLSVLPGVVSKHWRRLLKNLHLSS